MTAAHSILIGARADSFCRIFRKPPEIPGPLRLRRGKSMEGRFPQGITARMADEHRGIKVADAVYNVVGCPIVSERMKTLLEAHSDSTIDFHEFTLLDHKGRPATHKIYFANVLSIVSCIDAGQSEGLKDESQPGGYMHLDRIVLDAVKLSSAPDLFRLGEKTDVVIVRADLRAKIEQAQFSVDFLELGQPVRL